MTIKYIALAGAAFVASSAAAQAPAFAPNPAPAPALLPVASPNQAVLRSGTPISLRLSEQLTTRNKKSRAGTRFQLETIDPIMVDGQTVIPAGSPAIGEVTEAKGNGMWGKSGKMTARLLSVRANGRQVRLTGSFDDKGKSGTAGVVASVLVIPVAGFFVKGRSADIPAGTTIAGFIDEDVPLAFATTGPTPMTVAPAAPMGVAPTAVAAPTTATTAAVTPAVATTIKQ